jgi:hypothetical protein
MNWKRLLLIALVAGGLAFVPAQRSDAGVSVGIGFGGPVGYYGYYPYGYYPYRYYRPYPYYGYYYGPSYYRYGGDQLLPPPPSSLLPSSSVKVDVASRNPPSWLDSDVEPAFLNPKTVCAEPPGYFLDFGDSAGFAAGLLLGC